MYFYLILYLLIFSLPVFSSPCAAPQVRWVWLAGPALWYVSPHGTDSKSLRQQFDQQMSQRAVHAVNTAAELNTFISLVSITYF